MGSQAGRGGETLSQAVLGLSRRATQGPEVARWRQWFALRGARRPPLDQLGAATARLRLTGAPSRECRDRGDGRGASNKQPAP